MGLLSQFAGIVTVSIFAYLGALPAWVAFMPQADKVLHAIGAGVLAFLLDGTLGFRPLVAGTRSPPLAAVLVLAFAGIEEICQRLSPHRTSSFADFTADLLGVAVAALAVRLLARQPRAS